MKSYTWRELYKTNPFKVRRKLLKLSLFEYKKELVKVSRNEERFTKRKERKL